ncbi:MAG TPA: hypothetical protein VD905_06055 [Flavobacteriales bacterium]|nr:hypothetical protein [Flavobacteriales bacterium]
MLRILLILVTVVFTTHALEAQGLPDSVETEIYQKVDFKVKSLTNVDDAEMIRNYLIDFNEEKITAVTYDLASKIVTIYHTDKFYNVETLAIFRKFGHEAYYIKDNYVYRLNGTASGIVLIPHDPAED